MFPTGLLIHIRNFLDRLIAVSVKFVTLESCPYIVTERHRSVKVHTETQICAKGMHICRANIKHGEDHIKCTAIFTKTKT